MKTMNLDPFWRTSIGFDRLFDLMDESLRSEPDDHYPPAISCVPVRTLIASRSPSQVSRPNRPT